MTQLFNGRLNIRLITPLNLRTEREHTVCVIELDHRPPTLTRHVIKEKVWSALEKIIEIHGEPTGDNWMVIADYAEHRIQGDIQGTYTAPLPAYIGVKGSSFLVHDNLGRWFDEQQPPTVFQHDPQTDTYVEMDP